MSIFEVNDYRPSRFSSNGGGSNYKGYGSNYDKNQFGYDNRRNKQN